MANIKMKSITTTPDTPASGFIRIWSSGTTIKYITSDGNIRTLATGISIEEVQDAIGNWINSSTLNTNYDDANDTFDIELSTIAGVQGSYSFPVFDVDEYGRITSISNGPGIVRGDNFQRFKDTNQVGTTSSTPQLLYSFNTSVKQVGEYRVGFHTRVKPNATANDYRIEVRVDGTVLDMLQFAEEGKDVSGEQRNSRGGFDYITNTIESAKSIEVYGSVESSGTLQLNGCVIEIWRV